MEPKEPILKYILDRQIKPQSRNRILYDNKYNAKQLEIQEFLPSMRAQYNHPDYFIYAVGHPYSEEDGGGYFSGVGNSAQQVYLGPAFQNYFPLKYMDSLDFNTYENNTLQKRNGSVTKVFLFYPRAPHTHRREYLNELPERAIYEITGSDNYKAYYFTHDQPFLKAKYPPEREDPF